MNMGCSRSWSLLVSASCWELRPNYVKCSFLLTSHHHFLACAVLEALARLLLVNFCVLVTMFSSPLEGDSLALTYCKSKQLFYNVFLALTFLCSLVHSPPILV
jgi:hypothetical protein